MSDALLSSLTAGLLAGYAIAIPVGAIAALLITTETAVVEEVYGQPGAIMAPGFGDLAEGMVRPSNIY